MKPRKILLVEDSSDDELLIRRALAKAHVLNEVVVARDGPDALDYLEGRGEFEGRDVSELPSLVLLDLKLPRLSGLEVLKRIRANERTRLVPVVVLTSSDEEEDIVESRTHGSNSYVRKPVDFAKFGEAVQQIGMYWLLLDEPLPERG